jgi:integrase
MSIEKRKNAKGVSYRVRIFCKGLVFKEQTFKTKALAVEWKRKEETILQTLKAFPERPLPVPLCQLFDSWLNSHALIHKAASSVVKDRQMFKSYLEPRFGNLLVTDISDDAIQAFIADLKTKNTLSNNSINKILQLFKSLLNFALKKRILQFNPMFGIKLLPVSDEAYSYWTKEEASRFLSYANVRYQGNERWKYVMYLLLLTTGVRIREATAIYWECVNFDSGIIEISHSHDRFLKQIKVGTKGKKMRYVPLCPELASELKSIKNKSTSRMVFPGKDDGILDADCFRKRTFYRDIKLAGVRKIKIHDLRHTFASNYMMGDGNSYDLKTILGHSDQKMTERYTHLAPSHIASKGSVVQYKTDMNFNKAEVIAIPTKQEPRIPFQTVHSPSSPLSAQK